MPGPQCRYVVGSILSEGEKDADEELQKRYEASGFQVFSFPEVTHVVTCWFPNRTFFSSLLGVRRVYPRLARYIKVLSPWLSCVTVPVVILFCLSLRRIIIIHQCPDLKKKKKYYQAMLDATSRNSFGRGSVFKGSNPLCIIIVFLYSQFSQFDASHCRSPCR